MCAIAADKIPAAYIFISGRTVEVYRYAIFSLADVLCPDASLNLVAICSQTLFE